MDLTPNLARSDSNSTRQDTFRQSKSSVDSSSMDCCNSRHSERTDYSAYPTDSDPDHNTALKTTTQKRSPSFSSLYLRRFENWDKHCSLVVYTTCVKGSISLTYESVCEPHRNLLHNQVREERL